MHPVPVALAHREVLGGSGQCRGGHGLSLPRWFSARCLGDAWTSKRGLKDLLIPMLHILYSSCKILRILEYLHTLPILHYAMVLIIWTSYFLRYFNFIKHLWICLAWSRVSSWPQVLSCNIPPWLGTCPGVPSFGVTSCNTGACWVLWGEEQPHTWFFVFSTQSAVVSDGEPSWTWACLCPVAPAPLCPQNPSLNTRSSCLTCVINICQSIWK